MKLSFEEWLNEWNDIRSICDKDVKYDAILEAGQPLPPNEHFDPYTTLDRLMKQLEHLDEFVKIEIPNSASKKAELLELRKNLCKRLSNQKDIRLRARARSLRAQFAHLRNRKDIEREVEIWKKRLDTARKQQIPGLIDDFSLTIKTLLKMQEVLDDGNSSDSIEHNGSE